MRALNRATLARQLLLDREPLDVVSAVRQVGALQGQEPASPYLALWNRLRGFDPAQLDAAFTDGRLVKATLLRTTLHVVAAEDHRPWREAMLGTLRAARLNDDRFTTSGLRPDDLDAVVPSLVAFADRPRTRRDIEAFLAEHLADHLAADAAAQIHPGIWWALRTYAPLLHAPTGGPWSFGAVPAHVAAPDAATAALSPDGPDHAAAVVHLVRRYLAAFGPASAQDVARFALLRVATVRAALVDLADEVVTFDGPGRSPLYDLPDAPRPDPATPAPPRLLGMWDSLLFAHDERDRVIADEHRPVVVRRNGDALPTVLVDGRVAGVWRTVDAGIEVTPFAPLADRAWEGLAAEAHDLGAMLADRDPRPYRRFDRWWAQLPEDGRRILPV